MQGPTIECPAGVSPTGAYRIDWTGPEAAVFRLVERDATGAETVLYEGPDLASTVTGRTEGTYWYRVATVAQGEVARVSDACAVEVRPPSMALALVLFGSGLVVCLATVTVILRGHQAHKRGDLG